MTQPIRLLHLFFPCENLRDLEEAGRALKEGSHEVKSHIRHYLAVWPRVSQFLRPPFSKMLRLILKIHLKVIEPLLCARRCFKHFKWYVQPEVFCTIFILILYLIKPEPYSSETEEHIMCKARPSDGAGQGLNSSGYKNIQGSDCMVHTERGVTKH